MNVICSINHFQVQAKIELSLKLQQTFTTIRTIFKNY